MNPDQQADLDQAIRDVREYAKRIDEGRFDVVEFKRLLEVAVALEPKQTCPVCKRKVDHLINLPNATMCSACLAGQEAP